MSRRLRATIQPARVEIHKSSMTSVHEIVLQSRDEMGTQKVYPEGW